MNRRMMRLRTRLALLAVAGALAGCAIAPRPVRTEVTAYNEWATLPGDRTYTFARTLEFRDSLEMRSFEDAVRDQLAQQGFRLAADPAQASLVVTLRPSITWTRVRQAGYDAGFGPYGVYGGRAYGWYGGGPLAFYGGGFGGWPYGVGYPGFYGGGDDVDVYKARLELDIDARAVGGKRFYEGRVETAARSASLATSMPVLVRALFTDFPGNDGQTRRVDVLPVATDPATAVR